MKDFLFSTYEMKKAYQKNFYESSKKYQLTQNEIDVLLFLSNNPNYNRASDIIKYRCLTKSHVSLSIDALTKRSIIHKTVDAQDQRVIHLTINPTNQPMILELQKLQKQFMNQLVKNIDEEDLEIFKNIWGLMIQNIRSEKL